MAATARALLVGCLLVAAVGCGRVTAGTAVRTAPGVDEDSRSPVDVDTLMLDRRQMAAITGGGEDLTVIPGMDGKSPVDIDQLADSVPATCAWFFAETHTFGPEVEEFHKTTFQSPPQHAQISEGAAGYRDADTARRAFDALAQRVAECGATSFGPALIGTWTATDDALHIRTGGGCGRDYRVASAVLIEVTFCGVAATVPDIVMTNIVDKIPG